MQVFGWILASLIFVVLGVCAFAPFLLLYQITRQEARCHDKLEDYPERYFG